MDLDREEENDGDVWKGIGLDLSLRNPRRETGVTGLGFEEVCGA